MALNTMVAPMAVTALRGGRQPSPARSTLKMPNTKHQGKQNQRAAVAFIAMAYAPANPGQPPAEFEGKVKAGSEKALVPTAAQCSIETRA